MDDVVEMEFVWVRGGVLRMVVLPELSRPRMRILS